MPTSVQKAMSILTAMSGIPFDGITLGEISDATGINKSTCVHILNSLREQNYVEKISHSKGYRLGPGIYYLTRYGRFQEELIQICHPVMSWVHRKTGHTVLLAVIHENKKYIVHYIEGVRRLEEKKSNLYRGNVYASGTGRVMLSYFSRSELNAFVNEIGLPAEKVWPEIRNFENLWQELRLIRKQQVLYYSMVDDNVLDRGFASPVCEGSGKCVGAIAISMPKSQNPFEETEIDEFCLILGKAGREINRRMEYYS